MMTWKEIESAPADSNHVLITDGVLIFSAYRNTSVGEWRDAWDGRGMTDFFSPTHWMPLPEPPQ